MSLGLYKLKNYEQKDLNTSQVKKFVFNKNKENY